jgi:putative Flp pilus-assembly TadE/G-like protein
MKLNKQSGQVLVGVAFAMVVLAGFAGLAIDMGTLRYQKRLQQSAADGAAMAGADEIRYHASAGVTGAARNASTLNGFTDSAGNVSNCAATAATVGTICVQVLNAPANVTLPDGTVIPGGPHIGNVNYVEVLVAEVQPTYFMKIFGTNGKLVVARAVATLVGESGTAPGCVYTLGPPGTGVGVTNSGTPSLIAPTCGIEDNGDFTTNGSKVDITAGSIGAVGSSTNNGGGSVLCGSPLAACTIAQIPPIGDPLSFLQPPTVGTAVNWTGNPVPGTTYKSVKLNASDTINFPAGTYIIDGDFTINAQATVCNQIAAGCTPTGAANAGVTFYITGGGTVKINGGANVYLAAPNSGTYAGILFYQDPNDTSKAIIDGGSTSYYQGGLYFPSAELDFGGNSFTNATAAYTIIVADDLKLNGTSTVQLNSNFASLPGGVSIIENAILVE